MQFFWFDGKYVFWFLFIFDGLGSLSQSLDFQPLSSLQKCRQLILGNIHLASVHELQDGRQMGEGDVFEDNYGMLGRVLFQQGLEVGTTGGEDHLVSLAALTIAGNRHVTEGLLIPQVFEGGHHVGLEVVPSQTELLLVVHLLLIKYRRGGSQSVLMSKAVQCNNPM